MEMTPRVVIVLLNYKRYDLTHACLESLKGLEPGARVILVDQQYDEASLRSLLNAHPGLTAVPLEANSGYAEGMNQGLLRAMETDADHFLVLNNDTLVTSPLLKQLLSLSALHADAGLVGPALWRPDRKLEALGMDVNPYSGRIRLRGHGDAPEEQYPYPHKVDALPGTALLLRRKVLEDVGFFDPGYFLYFEDVEFCLRARKRGYACYVFPSAVVHHAGSATVGRGPERTYYALRNHLLLMETHGVPLRPVLQHGRSALLATLSLASVLTDGMSPVRPQLEALLQAAADYRAGVMGPRTSRKTAEA